MKSYTFFGRAFTFEGYEPHTTLDGRDVFLSKWRTPCQHAGCTAQLVLKTPGGPDPQADYWDNHTPRALRNARKFCDDHTQRHPLDHAAGGRASARISDQEVEELRALAASGVTCDQLSVWFPLTPKTIREIVAGRRRNPVQRVQRQTGV